MRKRFRVLLFAALVAAFVVPVGFAWSIDATPIRAAHVSPRSTVAAPAAAAALTSSIVIAAPGAAESATRARLQMPAVPDAAKLLLVGTMLFGLAAFVRKAI